MTRIKYHKDGKNLTSNYLLNYEGQRYLVMINKDTTYNYYTLHILNNNDVVFKYSYTSLPSAKRVARQLLINKYNVRLNEEIRPRS